MDANMDVAPPEARTRRRGWFHSPAPIAGLLLLIFVLGGLSDFLRSYQVPEPFDSGFHPVPLVATSQDLLAWRGTPVPHPAVAISPENAAQVQELARWGKGVVFDLAWSPDGQLLAAATSLGVYLYSAGSTEYVQFLPASTPVRSVAFSPDGQTLAAAGGTAASVWRLSDGELLRTVADLPGGAQDVVLTSANDLVIAGVVLLGPAWMWAGGNTAILNPPEGADQFSDVRMAVLSPDGQTAAGASWMAPGCARCSFPWALGR